MEKTEPKIDKEEAVLKIKRKDVTRLLNYLGDKSYLEVGGLINTLCKSLEELNGPIYPQAK